MAKRKITQTTAQEPDLLVDMKQVTQTATDFWNHYGKKLAIVVGGLAVVLGGYFGYKSFIQAPKQKEAVALMSQAQFAFERDSFQKALDPQVDGTPGFLGIIADYGGTPAGNMAHYYAGVCFLHLGQPDLAIEHLKSFDAEGEVMPIMAHGVLADAYGDKQDFDAAISHYKKAIDAGKNDVLTPYYMKKLGQLYEYQQKPANAKKLYEEVKSKFPNTSSAQDIDKYIFRATK